MIPIEFCETRLLSSLPNDDAVLLQRHLQLAFLHSGSELFHAGQAVSIAYFPLRGAIAATSSWKSNGSRRMSPYSATRGMYLA